ncbi:methyl-accepting chemotaxis protein [Cellulosilyticum sp. I15G10I2]|uniref:methyl-accepting chemotaxis protein n=1 Tax=Cellulosilyticum sp. I15G10I2 TaxID=1892843 RepID=UPI00085C0B66|nr:methyl-accepting chemotaxis protein [Cellulosilyticum sp. I15G10I2]
MKWFNDLKIRVKIILCFIILALFTGVIGIIGISNMGTINQRGDDMYVNNFLPAQNLAGIQRDLILVRSTYLLMLYEKDMTKFQQRVDDIAALAEKTNNTLTAYEKMIESDEERSLYNNLKTSLLTYREVRNEHINMIRAGNFEEASVKISEFTKVREILDNDVENLIAYNQNVAKEMAELSTKDFKSQSFIMTIIIIVGVLLAIGLGLGVANMISKPLNHLLEAASKIADGDLDVTINVNTNDEVGILAQAFRKMTDNLNDVVTNISTAAEQVASGSKQVSDSSMALSQGATEQASSVEELTASLEEIAAQTRHNADSADQANALAETAKSNAVQGNSRMKDMLKAMEDINDSSNSISKIIKVIDEIAFQTNILALNAAVEAARAGQHGKGFAVVAEEVRNLAARSANAAKETTDMIEGSIKKVEDGTHIASQTAEALNKIVEDVTRVADLVGSIAVASNEQAAGISQINQGIMQVSEVIQANSATAEEGAAASEELSGQAELLKEQVSRFNVRRLFSSNVPSYIKGEVINPEVLKMLEKMNDRKKSHMHEEAASASHKKIVLSDNEFGKY